MSDAIAALEQERVRLHQQLVRVDRALAVLRDGTGPSANGRKRGGGRGMRSERTKPAPRRRGRKAKRRAASAPARRSASVTDDATWARARKIAATHGLGEASRATGIKYATLYSRSKKEEWRLADGRKPPSKHASAPARKKGRPLAAGECPSCHIVSAADPCPNCGKTKRA